MELRTLLKILKRYWYLIVIPPVLVGVFTLITYRAPGARLTPRRCASPWATRRKQQTMSLYDRNYPAWLTSEYIAGGLSDWAKTGDFAQAVADEAGERHHAPAKSPVRSCPIICAASSCCISTAAMRISSRRSAMRRSRCCNMRNNIVFPQNGEGATVTALDGVVVAPAPPSLRTRLDIPIRIAIRSGVRCRAGLSRLVSRSAHARSSRRRSDRVEHHRRDSQEVIGISQSALRHCHCNCSHCYGRMTPGG